MPTLGIDTLPSQRVPQKILKKNICLLISPAIAITSIAKYKGTDLDDIAAVDDILFVNTKLRQSLNKIYYSNLDIKVSRIC